MADFFASLVEYLESGGPLMLPLALLAVYIYYTGLDVIFNLNFHAKYFRRGADFEKLFWEYASEKSLLKRPENGAENLGAEELRSFARGVKSGFAHLRLDMFSDMDRKLKALKILSAAAPLLGLLGTVSGMMLSIGGVAHGGGETVAVGISRALITTQAGLTIAIPALVLAMAANAKMQRILVELSRREGMMIRGRFSS